MRTRAKLFIVLTGYVLAFAGGCLAVYLQGLATQGLDLQNSSGMAAFGDAILFLAVFGILAILPNILIFKFFKLAENLWSKFALFCLIITGIEIVLSALNAILSNNENYFATSAGKLFSFLSIMDAFASPILLTSALVFATVAPQGRARRHFLVAAGGQLLLALYTIARLFFSNRFL